MVQAWYINDDESDAAKGTPRHLSPPKYVTPEELTQKTRVIALHLDGKNDFELISKATRMGEEHGCPHHDFVNWQPGVTPNFEQAMKVVNTEHFHEHDEIRFVMEGTGYFDVRDRNDKWIRVFVKSGDLIIQPAGIYHRFTLDDKTKQIRLMRLFDQPQWRSLNRPMDDHPARVHYVKSLA